MIAYPSSLEDDDDAIVREDVCAVVDVISGDLHGTADGWSPEFSGRIADGQQAHEAQCVLLRSISGHVALATCSVHSCYSNREHDPAHCCLSSVT